MFASFRYIIGLNYFDIDGMTVNRFNNVISYNGEYRRINNLIIIHIILMCRTLCKSVFDLLVRLSNNYYKNLGHMRKLN